MFTRVITALIAVALFIPLVWIGSWPLVIGMAIIATIGLSEFLRMKKMRLLSFPSLLSLASVFIIVLSVSLPILSAVEVFSRIIVLTMVLLFLYSLVFQKTTTKDIAEIILMLSYVGIGFYAFVALRATNLLLLALVLVVIWATDSGAYLIGRKIGKTKLAPKISPNKTVEGALGGTLLASTLVFIYLFFFPLSDSLFATFFLMVIISVTGQVGDLLESKLKREYGTKDSGNILPGHGGILDRFDSMLLVLNVLFILGVV